MTVLVLFAFLSGIVTILSPCILPVLPVVLSGGVGGRKSRPFGIVFGFVAGFSFFTLSLSAIVDFLGIPADALRWVAAATIVSFGLITLVPALRDNFEVFMSRISGRMSSGDRRAGQSASPSAGSGFAGGIPVGLSLGLVWTPCVGPIMASVISLAVSKNVDGGSVFIAISYSLGTALPMLAVMMGGRTLLRKVPFLTSRSLMVQKVFALLMIFAGVSIALQWDRRIQAAILRTFPEYGSGLIAIEDAKAVREALSLRSDGLREMSGTSEVDSAFSPADSTGSSGSSGSSPGAVFAGARDESLGGSTMSDYGIAPDFIKGATWINSAPLDLASLRGKVVIVDFWTYSCINCIRTIPTLRSWYEAYRDEGLVIVGVHSPEFVFERSESNVRKAMRDMKVTWPVVLDNDFASWHSWKNRYWPAQYFIDASGRVRYWHFGEGGYAESESILKKLLSEANSDFEIASAGIVTPPESVSGGSTPETYLGYARGRGFASAVEPVSDLPILYRPARSPQNGEWTLSGNWTIRAEHSESPATGEAVLELGFDARDVFLVIEPIDPGASISILLDGGAAPDSPDLKNGRLVPDSDRLYHLVSLGEPGRHVLRLELKGRMRLFAFTFG